VRIDVNGSQALKDVILALQNSDAETRRAIRTFTKAEIVKPWLQAVLSEADTRLERRVIAATATIAVSDQNIRIQSAAQGRPLRGGAKPQDIYAGVEFGGLGKKKRYMRKGQPVTRNTTAQFRGRRTQGYVFYPAAHEMIPRLARLWVQTVVKTYALIFDGKG
jgi:hypothetical protein